MRLTSPSRGAYNAPMINVTNIHTLPSDDEHAAIVERDRLRYNRIIRFGMTSVFLFGVIMAFLLINPTPVKAALDTVRALPPDATPDEVNAAIAVYHAELLYAAVELFVHSFLCASVTFACYVVFRKY